MTTLVLSVVLGPAGVPAETRHISSGEFTIGRGTVNDWMLYDPDCFLSKQHCVFRQDEAGWSVIDLSRNGLALANGATAVQVGITPYRLAAGDRLRIGDYEMAVGLEEDEASFRLLPLVQRADQEMPNLGMPDLGTQVRADGRLPFPPVVPPLMSAYSLAGDLPAAAAAQRANPAERQEAQTEELARMFGFWPRSSSEGAGSSLGALLDGTGLPKADAPAGDEAAVLQASGSALRALVRGLRRARAIQPKKLQSQQAANPLLDAVDEREALRWLLSRNRQHDMTPAQAIDAAFETLRLHHACLVQAGRQAALELVESLDPDELDRLMLPVWLDMLPGWRRARAAILARRRYRRLRSGLEQRLDHSFDRAYIKAWRAARLRWDMP